MYFEMLQYNRHKYCTIYQEETKKSHKVPHSPLPPFRFLNPSRVPEISLGKPLEDMRTRALPLSLTMTPSRRDVGGGVPSLPPLLVCCTVVLLTRKLIQMGCPCVLVN